VVQEAVRTNLESHAPGALTPLGFTDSAAVIVVIGRSSFNRERAKRVVASNRSRCDGESVEVQSFFPDELTVSTKWRARLIIQSDEITIASRHRTVPGVKVISHFERVFYPNIVGQNSVHCSPEGWRRPFLRNFDTGGLPEGVNSCVRAPSAGYWYVRLTQSAKSFFQNALDCSFIRLPLPPREARPVVLQHKLHAA
jgi:hypothetical protein